jgi:alanine-alpha-ketoisovalerate/valine-pyruvate aminotransferase
MYPEEVRQWFGNFLSQVRSVDNVMHALHEVLLHDKRVRVGRGAPILLPEVLRSKRQLNKFKE